MDFICVYCHQSYDTVYMKLELLRYGFSGCTVCIPLDLVLYLLSSIEVYCDNNVSGRILERDIDFLTRKFVLNI